MANHNAMCNEHMTTYDSNSQEACDYCLGKPWSVAFKCAKHNVVFPPPGNCHMCDSEALIKPSEIPWAKVEDATKPDHYKRFGRYEPLKVIRAWGLGFNLGNVVKYIARAPFKGKKLEDLKKAREYLDDEIAALEQGA